MRSSKSKFVRDNLERLVDFGSRSWAKLFFMLNFAVKTNNRKLFHKCNGEMADFFFAYDGQNYCRLKIIKFVHTMISST